MVHLKVINNGIEPLPHVVIAETGERVSGVAAISYSQASETRGDLTIVIVAGMFEIDVDLDTTRGPILRSEQRRHGWIDEDGVLHANP